MSYIDQVDRDSKLVAVTGPTGVGKTTFINAVCGVHLQVGTTLASCTDEIQIATCIIEEEKIILIDTPGFDDTCKTQADVLRTIADFLERTYGKGRTLAGVIYMHRISDVRVGGIARENFRLFYTICGKNAMKNVQIVTTMWEDVTEEIGARREQELASKSTLFKDAIEHGAHMRRLYKGAKSACDVISPFLTYRSNVLQLQHEIVDESKRLPQTSAGEVLQTTLDKQAERYRKELGALQEELERARARMEAVHREKADDIEESEEVQNIEETRTKINTKLAEIMSAVEKLNEPEADSNSNKKRRRKRDRVVQKVRAELMRDIANLTQRLRGLESWATRLAAKWRRRRQ